MPLNLYPKFIAAKNYAYNAAVKTKDYVAKSLPAQKSLVTLFGVTAATIYVATKVGAKYYGTTEEGMTDQINNDPAFQNDLDSLSGYFDPDQIQALGTTFVSAAASLMPSLPEFVNGMSDVIKAAAFTYLGMHLGSIANHFADKKFKDKANKRLIVNAIISAAVTAVIYGAMYYPINYASDQLPSADALQNTIENDSNFKDALVVLEGSFDDDTVRDIKTAIFAAVVSALPYARKIAEELMKNLNVKIAITAGDYFVGRTGPDIVKRVAASNSSVGRFFGNHETKLKIGVNSLTTAVALTLLAVIGSIKAADLISGDELANAIAQNSDFLNAIANLGGFQAEVKKIIKETILEAARNLAGPFKAAAEQLVGRMDATFYATIAMHYVVNTINHVLEYRAKRLGQTADSATQPLLTEVVNNPTYTGNMNVIKNPTYTGPSV